MPSKLKEILENSQFEINNEGNIVIYGNEPVARIMRELDALKITYSHNRDLDNSRFITISEKNINKFLKKKENRPVKRDNNNNNPIQIQNYTQLVQDYTPREQARAKSILSTLDNNLMPADNYNRSDLIKTNFEENRCRIKASYIRNDDIRWALEKAGLSTNFRVDGKNKIHFDLKNLNQLEAILPRAVKEIKNNAFQILIGFGNYLGSKGPNKGFLIQAPHKKLKEFVNAAALLGISLKIKTQKSRHYIELSNSEFNRLENQLYIYDNSYTATTAHNLSFIAALRYSIDLQQTIRLVGNNKVQIPLCNGISKTNFADYLKAHLGLSSIMASPQGNNGIDLNIENFNQLVAFIKQQSTSDRNKPNLIFQQYIDIVPFFNNAQEEISAQLRNNNNQARAHDQAALATRCQEFYKLLSFSININRDDSFDVSSATAVGIPLSNGINSSLFAENLRQMGFSSAAISNNKVYLNNEDFNKLTNLYNDDDFCYFLSQQQRYDLKAIGTALQIKKVVYDGWENYSWNQQNDNSWLVEFNSHQDALNFVTAANKLGAGFPLPQNNSRQISITPSKRDAFNARLYPNINLESLNSNNNNNALDIHDLNDNRQIIGFRQPQVDEQREEQPRQIIDAHIETRRNTFDQWLAQPQQQAYEVKDNWDTATWDGQPNTPNTKSIILPNGSSFTYNAETHATQAIARDIAPNDKPAVFGAMLEVLHLQGAVEVKIEEYVSVDDAAIAFKATINKGLVPCVAAGCHLTQKAILAKLSLNDVTIFTNQVLNMDDSIISSQQKQILVDAATREHVQQQNNQPQNNNTANNPANVNRNNNLADNTANPNRNNNAANNLTNPNRNNNVANNLANPNRNNNLVNNSAIPVIQNDEQFKNYLLKACNIALKMENDYNTLIADELNEYLVKIKAYVQNKPDLQINFEFSNEQTNVLNNNTKPIAVIDKMIEINNNYKINKGPSNGGLIPSHAVHHLHEGLGAIYYAAPVADPSQKKGSADIYGTDFMTKLDAFKSWTPNNADSQNLRGNNRNRIFSQPNNPMATNSNVRNQPNQNPNNDISQNDVTTSRSFGK